MKHRSISIILLFIVSAMLIGILAGCEGIGNATEAEAAESTNGMYDEYILTEEDLAELNEAYFHTLLYFDSSLSELDEATLKSYMADSIHPNSKGYEWMSGIFKDYLKEEYELNHPGDTI